MSIIDEMKQEIQRTSSSLSKTFYVKKDSQRRIRPLAEIDEAVSIKWHQNFKAGVNSPCREVFGEHCPYCDSEDENMKTFKKFMLPVYDVDANQVKIMVEKYNNWSPLPLLMGFYDTYHTIKDRDYIIKKSGEGLEMQYNVIPMDKAPFQLEGKLKAEIAKHKQESVMLDIIKAANPLDGEKKPSTPRGEMPKPKGPPTKDYWDIPPVGGDIKWAEMDPVSLYKECISQGITVEPRKEADYYLDKLMAQSIDDWGDTTTVAEVDPWGEADF